jgi:hypothetical protein
VYKRLAEAFYNFEYMLRSEPDKFNLAEFQIYEKFHLALTASYGRPMLGLANDMYRRIKAILAQTGS